MELKLFPFLRKFCSLTMSIIIQDFVSRSSDGLAKHVHKVVKKSNSVVMFTSSILDQSNFAEDEEIVVDEALQSTVPNHNLPENFEDQCQQSESSYDSSSSVDEGDGEDRKRRRNRNYVLIVPRSDIRRTYAQMLVNVLNSHSIPLIYSFFVTYSCHNLVGTHQFSSCVLHNCSNHDSVLPPVSENNSLTTTTLHGPLQMIMYFGILQQIIPDQIVRLKSGKIRTSSTRSTTIIDCEMQLEFTLLYHEVNPMAVTDDILHFIDNQSTEDCIYKASLAFRSHDASPSVSSNATPLVMKKCRKKMRIQKTNVIDISETFHVPNTLKYYSEVMSKSLSLETSPKKISLSFSLTMVIDSIRRILRLELKDPQTT